MGLGNGERKRPLDLRAGSSKFRSVFTCCDSIGGLRRLWQVKEIFRELSALARTRFTDVRTGSGSGGFSLRAHSDRMLFTTRE